MNAQYRATSRSARIVAALAALATVVLVFDFVAGLADAKSDPVAATRAGQFTIVVASAAVGDPAQARQ